MKQQTWSNEKVKKTIKDSNAQLFILDEANPKHKKLFLYYKIKMYPTIIFLDRDDLNNPLYRTSGFISPDKMSQIIKGKLKDE